MDWQTLQPLLTDTTWVGLAFALGLSARVVGLPPLVGFLATGFALNALGVSGGEALQKISDIGITLLLFTVGLKLEIRTLVKPHVWAVASLHILLVVLIFGSSILLLAAIGTPLFANMTLAHAAILAFAFSFSSTVFVVKVLEDKAEIKSQFGKVAIAILVMQDVAAVIFLATSAGKMPSLWALALFALIPMRPVFFRLLEKSGHSELLVLFGLTLALASAEIFELTGIKGGVGALIMGLLIAHHPKASELGKTLLGFKDLFLVGFFLSVGMSGELTWVAILIALAVVPFAFVKTALFFTLMTRFRLRARSSLLASLSLNNYSEFGLIVAAIGVTQGWLDPQWLVVISLALSLSFVVAAPLTRRDESLYRRFREFWLRFQSPERLTEDEPVDTQNATIAIFGMGRVGAGAYERMRERYGDTVIGIDFDAEQVEHHEAQGRKVLRATPSDADFWEQLRGRHQFQMVMLALPNLDASLSALEQLQAIEFPGRIAATARYPDENEVLLQAGADAVFNIYAEAGTGFADHIEGFFSTPSADN
jgi:glutathione-regulated potassium-efflux system ancillary protein KefC